MNSAIFLPEQYKFYSNGTPDCGITSIEACLPNVDVNNHIYIHNSMLTYIIPDTSDKIDKMLNIISKYFNQLKSISIRAHEYPKHGKVIDEHGYTITGVSISKGLHKVVPMNKYYTNTDNSMYEYDIHSCVIALLNYQYYISDTPVDHAYDPDIVNPLSHVSHVNIIKTKKGTNNIVPVITKTNSTKYFGSVHNRNSKYIKELIKMCKYMIDICWKNDKYDISRVVYGIVLGSIYLSMPSSELSYHLNISRALMELSSLSYRRIFGVNGQVFMDSIHITSIDEHMETSEELPIKRIKPNEKIIGKRYVKRRRRLNNYVVYNSSNLLNPEFFVYDITNIDSGNRGWYSYSPKRIDVPRMFHIDIHNAYPSLYYSYTGKTIDKRDFGKIKCVDVYLYQKIRKEVEIKSRSILESFDNSLMYWKTDGGIVMCNNDKFIRDLKIRYPDLLVDEIIDTKQLFIHESIDIPNSLARTDLYNTRVFAYKVYTPDSIKIVYANQFDKHKNKILEHNDMLGLSKYNSNILSEILTNRKE
jgi:hypothetical protein